MIYSRSVVDEELTTTYYNTSNNTEDSNSTNSSSSNSTNNTSTVRESKVRTKIKSERGYSKDRLLQKICKREGSQKTYAPQLLPISGFCSRILHLCILPCVSKYIYLSLTATVLQSSFYFVEQVGSCRSRVNT
jgi:hypothetical protein